MDMQQILWDEAEKLGEQLRKAVMHVQVTSIFK